MKLQKSKENKAISYISSEHGKPITLIGNEAIRESFEEECLQQAINTRSAPGVIDVVVNPDAHAGYGAPIGCVLVSKDMIYPGPIGFDISCSMSLLQLDIPKSEVEDKRVRRELINEIQARVPLSEGKDQRNVTERLVIDWDGFKWVDELARMVCIEGCTDELLKIGRIPLGWADNCEDKWHRLTNNTPDLLEKRFDWHIANGLQRT